ncbi:hypothetical protein [Pseudomonas yamanorum]|uniref:hypothetical protein n=1 Tax=Pseudomonas yamanorum TaxID=515393 RepID=UPI003F74AD78
MQTNLKNTIRFKEFEAYFGPRGVAVMAWWLGAVHAARIRQDHNSFPFLLVLGDARIGKNLLLNYLQKLTGQTPYAYSLARTTSAASARVVGRSGQQVIICEHEGEPDDQIDWDTLKPLYTEGNIGVRSGAGVSELHVFRGALVITANQPVQCSDAVTSRMININFSDENPHATRVRPEALSDIHHNEVIDFGIKVSHSEEWIASNLEVLVPGHLGRLTRKYGDNLSHRTAVNCAQILSLIDVLCALLSFSEKLLFETREVIYDIAYSDANQVRSV